MKIEWKIKKEAGHLRPWLSYGLTLEPFEIRLAVPMVRITSTIPKPPDAWQRHVHPGMAETKAGWVPDTFYELVTPSHQTGGHIETISLPMRPSGNYPEVEASFMALRDAYETALMAAYRNAAFEIRKNLNLSDHVKRAIAPAVVAYQLLNCCEAGS